jgi:hypothetical protein
MPLKLETATPARMYLGTVEVVKAYLGTTVVYVKVGEWRFLDPDQSGHLLTSGVG